MSVADQSTAQGAITEAEVMAAQIAWGEGIIAISALYREGGDYEARTKSHIDTLYAYDLGPVLFKPTMAAENQFRPTYDSALSYFVGREGTEDTGFAIRGWTNARWENSGITLMGNVALAMGNYFFTGPDGSVTKVEYTFGYVRDAGGNLRIVLHHSSFPYTPQ